MRRSSQAQDICPPLSTRTRRSACYASTIASPTRAHLVRGRAGAADPLQVEIVWFLTSDPSQVTKQDWTKLRLIPGKLFIVGDPKQSIYRFRRADIGIYQQVYAVHRSGAAAVQTIGCSATIAVDALNAGFGVPRRRGDRQGGRSLVGRSTDRRAHCPPDRQRRACMAGCRQGLGWPCALRSLQRHLRVDPESNEPAPTARGASRPSIVLPAYWARKP